MLVHFKDEILAATCWLDRYFKEKAKKRRERIYRTQIQSQARSVYNQRQALRETVAPMVSGSFDTRTGVFTGANVSGVIPPALTRRVPISEIYPQEFYRIVQPAPASSIQPSEGNVANSKRSPNKSGKEHPSKKKLKKSGSINFRKL